MNFQYLIRNSPPPLFYSFRKGSVVAEFKLTFKTKLKNEEALAPLKEGIKDGKLGSLSVDPKSLEIKNGTEGN